MDFLSLIYVSLYVGLALAAILASVESFVHGKRSAGAREALVAVIYLCLAIFVADPLLLALVGFI